MTFHCTLKTAISGGDVELSNSKNWLTTTLTGHLGLMAADRSRVRERTHRRSDGKRTHKTNGCLPYTHTRSAPVWRSLEPEAKLPRMTHSPSTSSIRYLMEPKKPEKNFCTLSLPTTCARAVRVRECDRSTKDKASAYGVSAERGIGDAGLGEEVGGGGGIHAILGGLVGPELLEDLRLEVHRGGRGDERAEKGDEDDSAHHGDGCRANECLHVRCAEVFRIVARFDQGSAA